LGRWEKFEGEKQFFGEREILRGKKRGTKIK
jgi:hypothetical protein